MSESEMAERAADAVQNVIEQTKEGTRVSRYDIARAVMAAIGKPTQAMVAAGGDTFLNHIKGEEQAKMVWEAMIGAALQPPSRPTELRAAEPGHP